MLLCVVVSVVAAVVATVVASVAATVVATVVVVVVFDTILRDGMCMATNAPRRCKSLRLIIHGPVPVH